MTLFEKLNIKFNSNGNTTISREKLKRLIAIAKADKMYFDDHIFPKNCFVLIDGRSFEFFPFPQTELDVWEKDGSFVKGDYLYKMKLIKKI